MPEKEKPRLDFGARLGVFCGTLRRLAGVGGSLVDGVEGVGADRHHCQFAGFDQGPEDLADVRLFGLSFGVELADRGAAAELADRQPAGDDLTRLRASNSF
ncbi:hypothetical protein [uncultured Rhodoblastus sp.]|uniref:hypothetical protein n=1 Tax=uncultured Rhodoblastus sp. TaxID=543037 RepID=UPI0025DB9612|nr:hypothetical protein [uncultured Rhodoblastus sp.]